MENKILSQSVADNILSMITIEKRFSVGDKLPNELELSHELNVSQTTLREAIKILVVYNILEIRRGKGTYVTEKALEQPQDKVDFWETSIQHIKYRENFHVVTTILLNHYLTYEDRIISIKNCYNAL